MSKKNIFLFIFIFLFCRTRSFAFVDPPISYLGIEQGLSNNGVTSIFQDHNGFMWFGTFDGLNRYDGYGFKIFRNNLDDSTSLNNSYVRVINEDADKQLWIGTSNGVNIYNPLKGNFYTVNFKPWNNARLQLLKGNVRSIQRDDKTGLMLVGSDRNGLVIFEKTKRTGLQISFSQFAENGNEYDIPAIAVDSYNQIAWIFVQHVGLCIYDFKTKTIKPVNVSIKKADCLKLDSRGSVWLGNENGLFRYDRNTNTFSENILRPSFRVMNLFEDKYNILWISSDGGGVWSMPIISNNPIAFVSTSGSPFVNSNAVYAIYGDADGNKWIGTLRGGITVVKSKAKPFRHITYITSAQNNIVNDFILSFAEDGKNNVWIGTDGAGLRYWNRKGDRVTSYKHDPTNAATISSDFVTSMICDSDDDLWAATWFGGINRLKKGSQIFEHFDCYNPYTAAVENNNWIVYEDSRKRLWASTTYGGALYLFNRSLNRFEVFDRNLINIHALTEDRFGNIWAGSPTSLIQIDVPNKNHKIHNLGKAIRCIHEDQLGNLWVGTDGAGLQLFDRSKNTFQRFTISDGLPSNTILCILEDNKKNLWLSTYNGLCRFSIIDKSSRNFSQSDGLQSNQFSFNAALILKSGEFLFGGIKGFNVFYPDSIQDKNEVPQIYLTAVKIGNESVEQDDTYVKERSSEWIKKIVLPFDKAVLSLDYLALDYIGNDKIRYAYKLEGWDKDWINANTIRTANYSGLHEGNYVFKIKIKNDKDEWGSEAILLNVVILPPWYRTWWAYVLYTVLIFSIIYLVITYYKRQQKLKYEIQLANYEARIANFDKEKEKELTEKKLSFFTNVSHEFRTPLTLIINPVKDLLRKTEDADEKKELNIVHRNARRLLSLIDQLLIFRKVDAGADNMKFAKRNFYNLCHEVYLCFVQQAKMNHQEYVFDCQNKDLELYVDKEKIEIALFNLISNAIKYTASGGKIILRITEDENEVRTEVIDDGCGISKGDASKLFEKFYQASSETTPAKTGFGIGLYLVKHFIEAHKGSITFKSVEGEGTSFMVKLSKGEAHLEGLVIDRGIQKEPVILEELKEELVEEEISEGLNVESIDEVFTDRQTILIVDDDKAIRQYLHQILKNKYDILEAENGRDALVLAQKKFPDLIISDIRMDVLDGIELCKAVKNDESINHIPVILLTGSDGPEVELQSIEGGADVYITKPFDKDILLAKVENLFKSRSELQNYFFNEVTLKKNTLKISSEYKEFLERCIEIVEKHLDDDQFAIKTLSQEIGMSHNQLYKRVKLISGQTVASFIRYIRLRKAAELMIKSDCNVNQAAYLVGISDIKYFRVQFNRLFGMNPSAYIKKYRDPFNRVYQLSARGKNEHQP